MTKPTKLLIDCSTGVSQEVELTDEEIAEAIEQEKRTLAERAERDAQIKAAEEAKASARAKLAALGLTEDEAKAIVG